MTSVSGSGRGGSSAGGDGSFDPRQDESRVSELERERGGARHSGSAHRTVVDTGNDTHVSCGILSCACVCMCLSVLILFLLCGLVHCNFVLIPEPLTSAEGHRHTCEN